MDVSIQRKLLKDISEATGVSIDDLFQLTLQSYEGILTSQISINSRNNFIQPFKNRGQLNKREGLRFCSLCLREDAEPYFRKIWRLSFSTACTKHNCYLFDSCPNCATPLSIYRSLFDNYFPHCYHCGFYFQSASPELTPKNSYGVKAVSILINTLDNGFFQISSSRYLYSNLYFAIVFQLTKIIYFWGNTKLILAHETLQITLEPQGISGYHHLEYITLKDQYLLFSAIVQILSNFPVNLISFIKNNRLSKTPLIKDMTYVPYLYAEIAEYFDMSCLYKNLSRRNPTGF